MTTLDIDVNEDPKRRSNQSEKLVENFFSSGVAPHNFKMAPNGERLVTFTSKGYSLLKNKGELIPIEVTTFSNEVVWDPDSRYFAFVGQIPTGGQAIYLVDTNSETPEAKSIYEVSSKEGALIGLEWSPWGGEIYFMENTFRGSYIDRTIRRIKAKKGSKSTILVNVPENIDFFMPPVSWFEHGQGKTPAGRSYNVVYGTNKGLFLLDRRGGKPTNLTEAPAVNLRNLEWSPDGKQIIMYYDAGFASRRFGELKGVTLVHLNGKAGAEIENLYSGDKIHTLWFSLKGKWILWAKESGCWIRNPKDKGKEGFRIPNPFVETADGKMVEQTDLPIKGAIWNHEENRLAITAGNQVWIYDSRTKKTEVYHTFGGGTSHFCAEPIWRGNRLVITVVENIRMTDRRAPQAEDRRDPASKAEIQARLKARQEFMKRRREIAAKFRAAEEAKGKAKLAEAKKKLEASEAEAEKKKSKKGN